MKNAEQMHIFDCCKVPLKIDKPIRLIELFAGIGSQAKALSRLGADFEHYRVCEFDKYAIKSYNAIHGTDFTTSDITQISASDLGIVDTDKYCYIITYSFPCQDLSLAGKGKGMAKGDNTRSGLLWEVERLLNECDELPQILLMENVTQVHGKKNKEHFDEWIRFLESKGYSNYWKDLNAKNFGIPQNRNRCFMVSVLGNYTYEFPEEFPLELRLKDMLEDNSNDRRTRPIYCCISWQNPENPSDRTAGIHLEQRLEPNFSGCSNTLTTVQKDNYVVEPTIVENCYVSKKGVKYICSPKRGMTTDVNANVCQPLTANGQANWTGSFISPDIESLEKSSAICGTEPTKINLKSGKTVYFDGEKFIEPKIIREEPLEKEGWHNHAKEVISPQGVCRTLCAQSNNLVTKIKEPCNLRIRKLTPKECWRLMGFNDSDFEKAEQVNSNSQLYKQAGNSIVVDVLCHIFREML